MTLERALGLPGAVLMGLGSILGTGVFVSIGIAAGVTGPAVILAVGLAALVATFNGLSSAQLAASHPVSGGTYEYGYRYLTPSLGFLAGWMFLCAKSASAATAALGLSGYVLGMLGVSDDRLRTVVAVVIAAALTVVVLGGMRRSSRTNALMVLVTVGALVAFVIAGLPSALGRSGVTLTPFFGGGLSDLAHATALMFVAYTGYGRIATLGEEVRDPETIIPRAIVVTLIASMALYGAVAAVAVAVVGADALSGATHELAAPLKVAAAALAVPGLPELVAVGAITAMLGVVLNLVLGLSRVLLAMARRRDMPGWFDAVHGGTPRRASAAVGGVIVALVLLGDVKTTWTFSAFTVLIYYAITNLAALRLPAEARRYPRGIAAAGLAACLLLAAFVPMQVWLAGGALVVIGLVWHRVARRLAARPR